MTPTSIDLYLAKLLLDQGLLNHYRPFILQADKTLWNRRSSTALLLKAIRAVHKSTDHAAAPAAASKTAPPPVNVLDLAASLLDRKEEILPAAATIAPSFQTQFECDWEKRTTSILQAVSELSQRPNPDNNEKLNWEQQFRRWIQQENFESCLMPDPSIIFSETGPAASRLETALTHQKTLEVHPWFYRNRPDLQPLFSDLELSREPRLPTYIYTLDHGCLEGGIEVQTTSLIAGVTSTGKSQLLRHMLLLPACHGEPTAYFSTEDSTDLIKKRSLSFLLKIPKRVMLEKTSVELEQMLEEACQTWNAITPGLGTQIYNNIRRKFFAIYLEKKDSGRKSWRIISSRSKTRSARNPPMPAPIISRRAFPTGVSAPTKITPEPFGAG